MLGHENRTTTEIYLHSIAKGKRSPGGARYFFKDNAFRKVPCKSHIRKKGGSHSAITPDFIVARPPDSNGRPTDS